jgi:hypothetical protein
VTPSPSDVTTEREDTTGEVVDQVLRQIEAIDAQATPVDLLSVLGEAHEQLSARLHAAE